MMAIDTSGEDWRRICEARTWIRQGYISGKRVEELRVRISAKCGAEAADELVQEMRRQWRIRVQWESRE
ncbi:MAG: hypothetical protein LBL59_00450 [Xanthomonadaceae bacterium]|jgi:CYTH domain-containing protein|nr:hypothetical protein [Xanthomonadaceae bacterium]